MKTHMTCLLAVCAAITITPAPAHEAPAIPSEAEIAANFGAWKGALASGDSKAVAELFAADAILEPTVSNQIRDTPGEVEAYFVDFLKLSPSPKINERHIRVLDENTAIDAGIWTFDLVKDGKDTWVTGRYCFVWEKKDGVWKIQLLHSSVMPEALKEAPATVVQ